VIARDTALHMKLGSTSANHGQSADIQADEDAEWDFSKLEGLTIEA